MRLASVAGTSAFFRCRLAGRALAFLVAPAPLAPGVQTHLLPAGHLLVPNMQPALSTGETLWFTVKRSTEPAKGGPRLSTSEVRH